MSNGIGYPFDASHLLRRKRRIRRELLRGGPFEDKRVAILGGSTTAEIKDMLELFLLDAGIRPSFYESDYNRWFEDVMFSNEALARFAPEIVYVHTSCANITRYPVIADSADDVERLIASEVARFTGVWDRIASHHACAVIQNSFELPHYRTLGSLDSSDVHGRSRFTAELNRRLGDEARRRPGVHLNDIHYLSACFGLQRWHDRLFWHSYKYAMNVEAIPSIAHAVASIVRASLGRARKCLVLDLDNTLWGGVIGDDGLSGIRLGEGTPEGEAFAEFQQYVKGLKERGVLLAVCSKNDEASAREGFSHRASVLSLADFACFKASWAAKPESIEEIARSLNIGIDSLVFADDNPMERDLMRSQQPRVAVPDLGSDVARFVEILDRSGHFEIVSLTADDAQRAGFYAADAVRDETRARFESYGDYLRSLEMMAEIGPFSPVDLERITQLTNKTNQFNVTTRRYNAAEIQALAGDDRHVTLAGRLRDRFGDNGLVSVMIGSLVGDEVHVDLWLMSCRVLQRGMEGAMLDRLVAAARERGAKSLIGHYRATARNGIVSGLFRDMGFERVEAQAEDVWRLDISTAYANRNQFIEVNG
jgi:FkbH-like protein